MQVKKCARCGTVKPVTEFRSSKENRDGLFSYCRPCVNAHQRERVAMHREKINAAQRKYYRALVKRRGLETVEERRLRVAATGVKPCAKCGREKPLDQFPRAHASSGFQLDIQSWCRICHNAYHADRLRKKYREDPSPYLASEARRRSLKQQNGGTLNAGELQAVSDFYGNACLRCGAADKICLDHVVPLAAGGRNDASNLQPLCRSCNSVKGARQAWDFRSDLGGADFKEKV